MSGNLGGARPGAGRPRLEATKLREALYREVEARADVLAKVIADKAETGDIPAWKEIVDRVMGKPHQSIDHTTQGESLNEKITTLNDEQLEQLIASVQGATSRIALGETAKDSGEPVEVREASSEATGVQ